jgi:Saxitoxin biosynthesis operon protein SxtJ
MKNVLTEFLKKPITKAQCSDTGMAVLLLLLLFSVTLKKGDLITVAIVVLVINMVFPQIYRPVALVWLGLSHLLGTVMSKILLTAVFFTVVTPVGLARRLLGKDSLKLNGFKAGRESVMLVRNHTFVGQDIEKPY